jgi:hypothetical protein
MIAQKVRTQHLFKWLSEVAHIATQSPARFNLARHRCDLHNLHLTFFSDKPNKTQQRNTP